METLRANMSNSWVLVAKGAISDNQFWFYESEDPISQLTVLG